MGKKKKKEDTSQAANFGKVELLKLCISIGIVLETAGKKLMQLWVWGSGTVPGRASFLPN